MSFSAEHYEALARQVTDPAAAEDYRQLAKAARKVATPVTAILSGTDRDHDRRLVLRDGTQRITLDAPGGITWQQEDRAADGSTETGRAFVKSQQLADLADRVLSPADRQGYLELARREREKAGL